MTDKSKDRRADPLSSAETKEALKEALKEWMDDKFAEVGKWGVKGLAVVVLTGIIIFTIQHDLFNR